MTKAERLCPLADRQRDFEYDFTVITRTQGNRLDVLEEALLSVYSQATESWQVFVMAHTADSERLANIHSLLKRLPPDLTEKVRVHQVSDGGRSRPLNLGLQLASGRWICHLDDDDLFLDNHFASVLSASEKEPDVVAWSTYAATRQVKVLSNTPGSSFPYTAQKIFLSHHRPFKLTYQLFDNALPICNVVVHNGFIRQYDLKFDESYEVLEDYRFWMEVDRFADIVCIPVVTTVITARDNQTNSDTDPATKGLWDEHRQRLRAEVFSQDRVVSGAQIALLAQLFEEHKQWGQTFKRLGVLFPLVKAIAKITMRVRHMTPAGARALVKRLLGRA